MTYILMANLDWFNGLPEDVQEAIVEAEAYGREESRKAYAEQEQEYLDVVKNAEGVHYYELTDEEIEAFKATVQPVYDCCQKGCPDNTIANCFFCPGNRRQFDKISIGIAQNYIHKQQNRNGKDRDVLDFYCPQFRQKVENTGRGAACA